MPSCKRWHKSVGMLFQSLRTDAVLARAAAHIIRVCRWATPRADKSLGIIILTCGYTGMNVR
jgi:hypothetical protein